jgi:serine/threonine-protein kinase
MSLAAGTRLGPYEVLGLIGAGGMGEVYKARDTRLDRTVAIKILPPELSADPDRRARFEREAKTIAGLAHPNICTLHDAGTESGSTYLVMELLTGETLAERLHRGPLPMEQALVVATEIADALAAAHRQGVIHRDLKPGNVMLTKTGSKLLDFGLAKLAGHAEQPAAAHLMSALTRSTPLTGEGVILGTVQYMAPEQLEGKPADARTDLWALGALLYEMLTGKRAFEGTSAASLIGAILEREPTPLSTLLPLTPPSVDRLVRQCLAKSPDDRPDTAHDLANQLRWMRDPSGTGGLTPVQPRRRRELRMALVAVGGLLLFAAGTGVMWLLRAPAPRAAVARPSVDVGPAEELNAGGVFINSPTPGGSCTALAWSPDGQALVFVGRRGGVQQLYVRRLDSTEARPLPNTEGAKVLAVSPDGQWVAFRAAGRIRKVPFGGGPGMDLASVASFRPNGLAWGPDGRLFFGGDDGRIWAIPSDKAPAAVTTLGEAEVGHTLPWPLPGGKALLYTVRKRQWSWGDEEVVAQTLATGQRQVLLRDAADARYVPSGHLVFLRRGQLFAVPFDVERLETRGPEVPVLDTVVQALTGGNNFDITGAGQFAVATTGTLAWVPGPVVPFLDKAPVTVDRHGGVTPLPEAPARSYASPLRLSPDGGQLIMLVNTLTERGVWAYHISRGTLTPLARDGEATGPRWFPDGRRVAFGWLKDGRRSLAVQPADADGTAPPQVLVAGEFVPMSFSPDEQLAASRGGEGIVIVTFENGQVGVKPLLDTPKNATSAAFSRNGRWLAYVSNISGRSELYVRPYPGPGKPEQVSLEGGSGPAWNPNGRELFFLAPAPAPRRRMMAADFAPGSPPDRPRVLFEFDPTDLNFACTITRCYDVARDGQSFYVMQERTPPPRPVVTHINLIPNWFEELKAKVPASGQAK